MGNFFASDIEKQPKTIYKDSTLNEVIVSFEKLSIKQYEELDKIIANLPGIKGNGYCQKLNCYNFVYDTNFYKNSEEAFSMIEKETRLFLPLQKLGVNSQMVMQYCSTL